MKTDAPRCCPRPSPKREAILDAAAQCFLDVGYAATSMDMVAARAGVSKATIYSHFDGKDALFGAVIHRKCEAEMGYTKLMADSCRGDARAVLTTLGHHVLGFLSKPETLAIYRLVVAEAPRHPDLAKAYYESGPMKGKSNIAAIFDALNRSGALKIDDCAVAADTFVALLRGEYFFRILLGMPQNPQFSLDETVRNAVETTLMRYRPAPAEPA